MSHSTETQALDDRVALAANAPAEADQVRRNFGWLTAERVLRLGVGLVLNVWIIRTLGPGPLGLLGFSQSLVGLFAVLAQLGLESILVRELVRRPEAAHRILGSGAAMRLVGATLCLAGAAATVWVLRPGDLRALILVLLLGGPWLFHGLDVIEGWFQSRSQIGISVAARLAAFTIASGLKIAALLLQAPLEWLAAAIAAEIALTSLALAVAYRVRGGAIGAWRLRLEEARHLGRSAVPMILNSMAIMLYSRADQVMIAMLRGDHENGLYAAAQRLSEVSSFVPTAAVMAASPALYLAFERSRGEWERRLQRLFEVLLWTGIALALVVSLLAGPLTRLLFGPDYRGSAPVLALHVWSAPALFLGVAQTNWFLAQRLERGLLLRSLAGAVFNIALNFALIPTQGARGAALATLLAQLGAAILLNAAFRSTRPLLRMQLRAFVPWRRG